MHKIKTAVVILNWNGIAFLEKFLGKVQESIASLDAELIIADNGSSDNSVEWLKINYPEIKLIEFDKNHGFTGGYNKALAQIEAEYYVLLNSDIDVTNNWLSILVDYMDNNADVAACAPKLRSYNNPDFFEYAGACGGFIDKYGYPFCRGRILDHIEKDSEQYNNTINVFWATGAALMIRADLYHKAGGLDNSFFAHMEEIDLCWRLQLMGYKVSNVPSSVVFHVGGGTLPNDSPRKLFFNYRNNLMMLMKNTSNLMWYIVFVRLVLDGMSGMVYLLSGKFSSFAAVIKAHWAFFRKIPQCLKKRKAFKPLIVQKTQTVYCGSIVYRYFRSGKKIRFSEIFWK